MSERPSYNPESVGALSDHAFFTADLPNGIKMGVYKNRVTVTLEDVCCYFNDDGFSYELNNKLSEQLTRQRLKLEQRKVFGIVGRIRSILLSKGWCINTPTQPLQKRIDQLTSDELIELAELVRTGKGI